VDSYPACPPIVKDYLSSNMFGNMLGNKKVEVVETVKTTMLVASGLGGGHRSSWEAFARMQQ